LAPFCQAVSEEKVFLNSSQSETRIALAAIFVGGTERNGETL
jgi:hypothetical protein